MKIKRIKKEVEDAQEKVLRIKKEIFDVIRNLPDNPNIKRLGDKAFVMSSKNLLNNWTPQYYDFQWQYKRIIELIKSSGVDAIIPKLEEIIKTGEFRQGREAIKFHPDVIENLKKILY